MYLTATVETDVEFEVELEYEDGAINVIVTNGNTSDCEVVLQIRPDGEIEYFSDSAEDLELKIV